MTPRQREKEMWTRWNHLKPGLAVHNRDMRIGGWALLNLDGGESLKVEDIVLIYGKVLLLFLGPLRPPRYRYRVEYSWRWDEDDGNDNYVKQLRKWSNHLKAFHSQLTADLQQVGWWWVGVLWKYVRGIFLLAGNFEWAPPRRFREYL